MCYLQNRQVSLLATCKELALGLTGWGQVPALLLEAEMGWGILLWLPRMGVKALWGHPRGWPCEGWVPGHKA